MVNKLAEYWLQHCNFDTVSFPRYVGFPNQFLVSNEYEYVYAIDKYLNEKNCYVRAFSEFQLDHNLYNKLYFDFDSKNNLDLAYKEVLFVFDKIESRYHVRPRIYFTGAKGFHLYID